MDTSNNYLAFCPRCLSDQRMTYIFTEAQKDECAEIQAWRFQECLVCGWTGDCVTRKFYQFRRFPWGLFINGRAFYQGLPQFLKEIGLCPPTETP